MRGPFPPIRHRKHRKYTKYSRCFLYCLDEKSLSQNCCAPQKERFLCRTRRKAQEYWPCIPSIFNEVRREKILFAAIAFLSCTPLRRHLFFCQRRRPRMLSSPERGGVIRRSPARRMTEGLSSRLSRPPGEKTRPLSLSLLHISRRCGNIVLSKQAAARAAAYQNDRRRPL